VSGITYHFRVLATNNAGNSAYSSAGTQATVSATAPVAAPTSLSTSGVDSSAITVNWTGVAAGNNGGAPIQGYRVQQATNAGFTTGVSTVDVSGISAVSQVVSNLSASTQYYFRVAAFNTVGAGPYSSSVNATTSASSGMGAPSQFRVESDFGQAFIDGYGLMYWTNPSSMTSISGFDIEAKKSSSGTWIQFYTEIYGSSNSTPNTEVSQGLGLYDQISPANTGINYDIRIRSRNSDASVTSSWTTLENIPNETG
jgi:hypothetical protein